MELPGAGRDHRHQQRLLGRRPGLHRASGITDILDPAGHHTLYEYANTSDNRPHQGHPRRRHDQSLRLRRQPPAEVDHHTRRQRDAGDLQRLDLEGGVDRPHQQRGPHHRADDDVHLQLADHALSEQPTSTSPRPSSTAPTARPPPTAPTTTRRSPTTPTRPPRRPPATGTRCATTTPRARARSRSRWRAPIRDPASRSSRSSSSAVLSWPDSTLPCDPRNAHQSDGLPAQRERDGELQPEHHHRGPPRVPSDDHGLRRPRHGKCVVDGGDRSQRAGSGFRVGSGVHARLRPAGRDLDRRGRSGAGRRHSGLGCRGLQLPLPS